ncbi:VOC family protein [Bacillus sp. AK128]
MNGTLVRIGTIYLPVTDLEASTDWYVKKLAAEVNYKDTDKSILNLANMSILLVKALSEQSSNFIDSYGNKRFSMTFEVDGLNELTTFHKKLVESGVTVGEIENRGHAGRNFIFHDPDGNIFDVWSELSPTYKQKSVQA